MSLPCLHSMCTRCLASRNYKADQLNHIRCPICAKSTKIPLGGVKAFPKDTFYGVLRRSLTHSHEDVDLSSIPAPFCGVHPSHRIDIYCKVCQLPICDACFNGDHKSHDVEGITSMAVSVDFDLKSKLAVFIDDCLSEATENLDQIETNREQMEKDLERARVRVVEEGKRLREEITRREELYLFRIDATRREMLPALDAAQQMHRNFLENVSALKVYAETLQSLGSDFDKVSHVPGIREMLKKERDVKFETFTWQSDMSPLRDSDVINLDKLLGEVNIDQQLVNRLRTRDRKIVEKPALEASFHFQCDNMRFPEFVPLYGQLYLTHIYNLNSDQEANPFFGSHVQCLCFHDEGGKFLKRLHVPGVKHFGRTSVINPEIGRILVECTAAKTVIGEHRGGAMHWLTLNRQLEIITHDITKLHCIPGLCTVDWTGQPISTTFCVASRNPHPCTVLDMNHSGIVQKIITLPHGEFGCPLSAIRHGSDGYIISDTLSDHVAWVNEEGTMLRRFHRESLKPFNFIQHPHGFLIIPDWGNSRVYVVSMDGKMEQELLTTGDGIQCPRRLYLDDHAGRLYVAQSREGIHWQISIFEKFKMCVQQPLERHLKLTAHF